jgi:hypothetical protein
MLHDTPTSSPATGSRLSRRLVIVSLVPGVILFAFALWNIVTRSTTATYTFHNDTGTPVHAFVVHAPVLTWGSNPPSMAPSSCNHKLSLCGATAAKPLDLAPGHSAHASFPRNDIGIGIITNLDGSDMRCLMDAISSGNRDDFVALAKPCQFSPSDGIFTAEVGSTTSTH